MRTIARPGLALIALLLIVAPAAEAGKTTLQGTMKLGGGYLEHPIGLANDEAAGYFSQTLRLAALFDSERDRLKLGYEGSASQFGNDTELGSIRHGVGVEWFHLLPAKKGQRPSRLSIGVQGADRSYEEFYSVYDYQELYSYIAFRKYRGVRTLLKGYVALKLRDYGNILGESYREPHGKVEIRRSFQSRTTLGASLRYGAKFYYDAAASEVWETLNLPSTSQLSTRLSFSQGIGQRVGFRCWGEHRRNFDEYPHYIDHLVIGDDYVDVFDSPLLDRYAREGLDVFAAVKVLAPRQIWLEFGSSYGDYDYGELLFPSNEVVEGPDEGQTRTDELHDYYVRLTKTKTRWFGRPRFVVTGGFSERASDVDRYSYDGLYVSGSATWRW